MPNDARFIRADRFQTRWDFIDLEALLTSDHRARIVWSFVEALDLSPLYEAIQSREGEPGRPPPDPAVLLALWLYATIEGMGSARQLERLAQRDLAYRWLAGGVPLNYHGLADFRVRHVHVLDRLLTESVTALVAEGVVSLSEIAVDGTKVRAHASRGSFKTADKLTRIEAAVERRLAVLKAEVECDPEAPSRRQRAAQERAAREVKERAQKARAALEKMRAEKERRRKKHPQAEAKKKSEPSASLSDAEARSMRFPDGAVRPAYNAQIAVAPRQGIIVSVAMTDRRNDAGLAVPMVDDLARRYGKAPQHLLVDTHYATSADIAALALREAGPVKVFAPPPREGEHVSLKALSNRKRRREREPESVREWRRRMETPAGQAIFSPSQVDRAGQCPPQEPWLRLHSGSRPDQGESDGALACTGKQSDGRVPTAEAASPLRPLTQATERTGCNPQRKGSSHPSRPTSCGRPISLTGSKAGDDD